MSRYIDDKAKNDIEKKIKEIESKSSAEVAIAIANGCDNYRYTTFLYALLFSLVLPILPIIFGKRLDGVEILSFMAITFVAVFYIIESSKLKFKLPSKIIKKDRCEKKALFNFYKMGIDRTKNRRAILIFISLQERFIRVIADEDIKRVISDSDWDKLVKDFISFAKDGKIGDGILHILDNIEDRLKKEFPKDGSSEHIISNEVIEI